MNIAPHLVQDKFSFGGTHHHGQHLRTAPTGSTYGQAREVYGEYCKGTEDSIRITQGSKPVDFEITKEQITEWLLNPQPTDT